MTRQHSIKVLYLEDSVADFEIISNLLINAEFDIEISRVDKELEFKAFLVDNHFDIILADYNLPGFDAFAALHIRNQFCPEVPFICVFDSIREEQAIELLKSGASDYVLKDRPRRLPFAIRQALNETKEKDARGKAEEEKRKKEEQHRLILQTALNGFLLLDRDSLILEVNEAYCNMSGYSEQELLSMHIFDLEALENEGDTAVRIQNIMEKGEDRFETVHRRKDGSTFDVEVNVQYKPFEEVRLVAFLYDITESKQMEEELLHEKLLLHSLMEYSPDVIYFKDSQSRFIRVNRSLAGKCGLSDPNDILGKTDFDLFEAVHSQEAFNDEQQIMRTGNPIINKEEFEIWQDGQRTWALTTKLPFYDKKGKIIGTFGISKDITDRKLAEQELKKLSMAVEQSPVSILITDTHGNIEYGNPKILEITGYKPEELIGKNPRILNSGGKSDIEYRKLWETITSGNEWHGEFHNRKKNGELYWEQATISPILDEKGTITHFLAVKEDITVRKKEEQIKNVIFNISKAATATENLVQLIGFIRQELGTIIDTTNFFLALYDKQTETISLPFFVDEYDDFQESKPIPIENTTTGYVIKTQKSLLANLDKLKELDDSGLVGKSGADALIWLGVPIKINREVIGALVLQNYSDASAYNKSDQKMMEFIVDQISLAIYRKNVQQDLIQAKEKAEESEEKYRALYNNAPLSYQSLDEDGCIKDVNPTWLATMGYERDEVLGDWFGNYLHPDYVEHFRKNFPEFKKRGFISDVQFIMKKKERSFIHVSYEGCIGYTPDGKFKQTYCVFKDITEQRALENHLIKAKEKAEQSDQLKSAFLANMSHEIRTPMNGILGFSNLLKNPKLSGEKQQKYIQIIEKSGTRMLNIIDDLVSISKIESGITEAFISETNINEQIDYVHDLLKLSAAEKKIRFTFEKGLPDNTSIIETDKEKFTGILSNLVKNAIKFTEEGSLEFGYVLKNNGSLGTSPFLEFYVKDTGIGIPADKQEVIFDRFMQADISDKMARQGTGLGLAISKAYVAMLGGNIWLESEEGKGSTFYFTIPYRLEPERLNGKENEISKDTEIHLNPEGLNLKILIAEDDESSEMLLELVLEPFGKEILKAGTGIETVEACRSNPDIDLIFMDIQMPDLNGYEATRQIRQFNKDVIIIAQTAFALSGDREKAIEAGCNDYLTKPIKKDQLYALMQKYFREFYA